MDALLAKVPIAGRQNPMPSVVKALAHKRLLWSWSAPKIIINRCGHGLGAIHFSDAGAAFVTEAASANDFSESTLMKPGDGLAQTGIGAALSSRLYDAAILAGSGDDLAAFPNIMRDWFFQ